MAVIDFKCTQCGKQFFEVTTSKDRAKVRCPQCGTNELKQVFGGTAYLKTSSEKGKGGCGRSCSSCGSSCG
ncbi:hypothetical protein H0A61_01046 [Koleobacter methoxysyntrophicus]|uniref:Putative regulatory protein FmdB zinc ribbon domain-containing protein n=1 Tax=Koleobacter methoxysyntrophicus TaxID=2751313 RepID=A0A8A0RKF2_9FIRM|nr:zinc ribbon domain-containing protein [Koleobacter methoxysyntrophicus]QSQ08703.1 hypothetical protein H0A61_01046 [Koleobacter methoxysyntrophicus]